MIVIHRLQLKLFLIHIETPDAYMQSPESIDDKQIANPVFMSLFYNG